MPFHKESIKAIDEIKLHSKGKRIVFVSGIFNILHPGHLRLLRFAKECGDYLAVGVSSDGTFSAATLQDDIRLEGIRAINWVDYGFILKDPLAAFIKELKPAFVVKGKEFEGKSNPEAEVLKRIGGKLLFCSGDISFSSIDSIRLEWRELNPSTIKKPLDFPERHGFDNESLAGILDKMSKLKICILGDTIVDEYITCDALGMSQEDPTIVVMPIVQEKFVGGAGIVAAHARGLGSKAHYFSVTGKDATSDFVKKSLEEHNVDLHLYTDESRPTTLKQRYRVDNKTLLRVSHLRQHAVNSQICKIIYRDVCGILDDIDLLIFSDFNYGCLPQELVNGITHECRRRKIMMAADSQSSSQVGDVSRFYDMVLLTPTEHEARLALHDFESGLVIIAEKLKNKSKAKYVIITLGAEGILIHSETDKNNKWLTDKLPALNIVPKDVAGAGDSFLTCASMSLAARGNIWQSAYMGSLAAACQVGRVGNLPLSAKDLKMEIIK